MTVQGPCTDNMEYEIILGRLRQHEVKKSTYRETDKKLKIYADFEEHIGRISSQW